ncbi:putative Site-specific integrase [Tenacibaculum sp. 190130A14a]|uniref:Site-specific integrase n=1 Tax=Tenacibaculum polynesiense TaxID=3137857 RepID=A0ABP1F069_9FLAO
MITITPIYFIKSKSRYPIVFRNGSVEYQFIKYLVINIRNKSYRTLYNHALAYKYLVQYLYEIKKEDFVMLLKNNPESVLECLKSFDLWLNDKLKSKTNFNIIIDNVCSYLQWYFYYNRFNFNQNRLNNVIQNLKFSKYKIKYIPSYNSLNTNDITRILNLCNPDNIENPFKHKNRVRNYLVFLILIETGIRLSELLLLRAIDFIRNDNLFFIKIDNNINEKDIRRNTPSYKNSYSKRIISISDKTYLLFEEYLFYYRKNNGTIHYLFTSDQNKPLSKSSVQGIIKEISKRTSIKFSAHTLRHYFAESMLEFLIDKKDLDMERAKDELRVICGWSFNSNMPSYYARRMISKMANKTNMQRILNYE